MIEQQDATEHAALGNTNNLVNVVHTEGENATSKRNRGNAPNRRPRSERAQVSFDGGCFKTHSIEIPLPYVSLIRP